MRKTFLLLFLFFFQLSPLKANTVVLVHGFLLSGYHLKPMEINLRSTFPTTCFDFPSRKEYVQDSANRLVHYLKCLANFRPGEPIYFVSHSIGGLILRAALNHPDCPEEAKVGRAVLLGPPNQGSIFARYFKSWSGVRFLVGDKSGYELMSYNPCDIPCIFGEFPQTMEILVVAGCKGTEMVFGNIPNDGYLTIEETRLNTPHYHIVLPLSHGELVKSKKVACLTKQFLLYGCPEYTY